MSSSEEEVKQKVTVVKRRRRVLQNVTHSPPVKLYSKKVMPTLRQSDLNTQKQLNLMNFQLQPIAKKQKLKDINRNSLNNDCSLGLENKEDSDDCDVKFVSIKPGISLTPPPPEQISDSTVDLTLPPKNLTKIQKKRLKMVKDLETIKTNALGDDSLNDSQDFQSNMDDSLQDLNKTMVVKVRFLSKIYKFPLTMQEPFLKIFEQLATRHKTDKLHLLLTLQDRKINYSDTPESLNLSVADIIDGFLFDQKTLKDSRRHQFNNYKLDCIQLHFQCQFQKIKRSYSVNKYEPLNVILKEYAKAIEQQLENLIFQFDGDNIDMKLTPIELELENDFCIDVMRKKI